MDLFTITAAVLSGAAVGAGLAYAGCRARIARYSRINGNLDALIDERDECLERHLKALRHLRRNAFITNSKGHRVRYTNATAEERARAEGEV